MSAAPNHFGRREAGGVVVDLFWDRRNLADGFRVKVKDGAEGTHCVLYPTTGKEAAHAFRHPFVAAHAARNGTAFAFAPPRPADDAIGWTTDTDEVAGW